MGEIEFVLTMCFRYATSKQKFYCTPLLVLLLHAFITPLCLIAPFQFKAFAIIGGSERCFCVFRAAQLHFMDQRDHRAFIVTAESDKLGSCITFAFENCTARPKVRLKMTCRIRNYSVFISFRAMSHPPKHVELNTDEIADSKSRATKNAAFMLHNFCLPIFISSRDFSRLFGPTIEEARKGEVRFHPSRKSFVAYRNESNRFVDGNQNKLNENFERFRRKQKLQQIRFICLRCHRRIPRHIKDFVS